MKTREEQIKEMTADMSIQAGLKPCEMSCEECQIRRFCPTAIDATYAIDAGYRKQSDTVREFVERLKQSLIDLYPEKNEKISLPDLEIDGIDIEMTINNLAEEYGVEVGE